MRILAVAALGALALANGAAPVAPRVACYAYESDSVRLAGRLARRVYPGPPNYESVRAGDAPDTVLVLRLDRPACTRASADFAARAGVREVQLLVSRPDLERAGHLLGRRVVVRGTLDGAVLGWHHLPVLLRGRLPAAAALRSAARPRRQVRPNEALQLTDRDSEHQVESGPRAYSVSSSSRATDFIARS